MKLTNEQMAMLRQKIEDSRWDTFGDAREELERTAGLWIGDALDTIDALREELASTKEHLRAARMASDGFEGDVDKLSEELKATRAARFGRCREMGGGMLMVFEWCDTMEEAQQSIPVDSPVKQFVIARYPQPAESEGGEG